MAEITQFPQSSARGRKCKEIINLFMHYFFKRMLEDTQNEL